jgi:hypothetical protein
VNDGKGRTKKMMTTFYFIDVCKDPPRIYYFLGLRAFAV